MRKVLTGIATIILSVNLWAVPAYRGWQTRTQPDGTTIEVQQFGDEFYHYMVNRDGMQVKQNAAGMYEVVGEAPSPEVATARRAQAKARRMRKVGTTPNKAPRGVVILANFKDKQMQSSHTQAVFDELCNSTNCTVNTYDNVRYGSAAQYFADQSNGAYRPQFDVYGPVTLSRNYAYYGEDGSEEGDDRYATTAVVEACLLANAQYSDLDFTNYDSNNDGKVDFVYVIYAGKGQADGGDANTIWPHNWEVESAIYYGNCTYTKEQAKVDGKYLNNYACSAELSGSNLSGIGTLCHEFGHVMGLPDFYDTNYGTNYKNDLTPNEWDIMDGGSYNGGGHCPPNYDPWEKYFFGWVTPVNPGSEGTNCTLNANGTADYNIYQINSSGNLQTATTGGLNYYVENRQQSGWDKFIPAHGMVIWKCNYSSSDWSSNTPNNTANAPKFTIVCSSGTRIGSSNGSGNVFGGSNSSANSWSGVSGKPLTEIKETNKVITFKYMGGAAGHNIVTNATGCTITPSVLTVENGVGFTATILPKSNVYEFTSLTVTLGSTTLTQNTHYTLSNDHKTLTVLGSAITGATGNAVTITAVWSKAQCSYEILQEPEACTISSESGTVPTNSALNLTITPASGYSIADADCWDVEMGEQKLIYGVDFTYNSSTGAFSIAKVVDDVAIFLYPGYIITWQALGTPFATTIAAGGKLVLPQGEPAECSSGKIFVGWCATPYEDEAVAPTFAKDNDAVSSAATYYAVYADMNGSGSAEVAYVAFKASSDGSTDYSSSIASKLVSTSTGISSFSGNKLYEGKDGVKIGAGRSNGYITLTLSSFASISEVKVNASKYGSDTGKLEVEIGETSLGSQTPASNLTFTAEPAVGSNTVTISTTSKRAYIASISIMAGSGRMSGYTTSCTPPEKHKINLNTGANGSVTSVPADSAYNGAQVALTITPSNNYRLATLVVKDASNQDITVSGEGNTRYFRMPDMNVTVTSTFEAIPSYTIGFYNGGTLIGEAQQVLEGQQAQKPANPVACEGYTFEGWWTEELDADNTQEKTWVTDFTAIKNQNYYAAYSFEDVGEGNSSTTINAGDFSSVGSGNEIGTKTFGDVTIKGTINTNGSNAPKYYSGSPNTIRFYSGNMLTISATQTISQIDFTYDGSYSGGTINRSSGSWASTPSEGWDQTWTGETESVAFTVGSTQWRITAIKVTVGSGSTTYYTTEPDCVECTSAITLTKGSASNGSFALDVANGAHSTCGAALVVTVSDITPATGYKFKEITQTGLNEGVTIDQENKTVTYAKKTNGTSTINVVFEELPKYAISFYDNGEVISTVQYYIGDTPEVPADPTPECEDYTFVGWWSEELDVDNTSIKSWISDFTVSGAQDYYAIYSKTVSGGSAVSVSDQLTRSTTGVSSTSYTGWSNKSVTSNAKYAGQSAGGNESIQLRTDNSNSGIITTVSGGKISKVTVDWNSNTAESRTLDVYGKNSAYSSASDLYGNNAGTKLGSIAYGTSTELTISGDYTYVGVRSNNKAMYLTSITFTWSVTPPSTTYYSSVINCSTTAMDEVKNDVKAIKRIENGQIVIIVGENKYTIFGQKIQ